jgi:ABC-type nitrate/sulfonate/bicarbonate transport system permease component
MADAGVALASVEDSRSTSPRSRLTASARLQSGPPWLGGAVGIVALVIIWTLISVTSLSKHGAIPKPWSVIAQYHKDGWSYYWPNVSVTLRGALEGFVIGNVLALLIAVVVLLLPQLEKIATQVAVITYCMPLTAIGPIILVVKGGRAPTVFLAAIAVFFTTLIGALLGLKAADRASLDVVAVYGGGRWQQMLRVQAIAALPSTISGLKIAAPAALLGAIIGEYLGGVDSGLGVAITSAQQQYDVPRTWGLAFVCGAIAGLGYFLIGLIGRLLTPWAPKSNLGVGS